MPLVRLIAARIDTRRFSRLPVADDERPVSATIVFLGEPEAFPQKPMGVEPCVS